MSNKRDTMYCLTDQAKTSEAVISFVNRSLANWEEEVRDERSSHPFGVVQDNQWLFVTINRFPNENLQDVLEAVRRAGLNSKCTTTTGDTETQLLFKFHVMYLFGGR